MPVVLLGTGFQGGLEPGGLIVELKCSLLLGDGHRPQTQKPKTSCSYRWETDRFFSGFVAKKHDKWGGLEGFVAWE